MWNVVVVVVVGLGSRGWYLVGFLCAKLDIGGVNVAVTYSTHFHLENVSKVSPCIDARMNPSNTNVVSLFRLVGEAKIGG